MNNNSKIKVFNNEIFLLFIVLIFSCIVLFPISDNGFLSWDDDMILTQNPYVKNLNSNTISHNFTFDTFTFLTYTIFSVIYQIWGENPLPFHLFSIIIHLLNIILVFHLLKNFFNNKWIVFFITILFAIHPTRIESVAWISETKGLLFGMFALISYNLYIKYLKSNFKTVIYLIISAIVILASLSKIQGLLIPISFFVFDFYYRRNIGVISILEKVFLLILLISITNPLFVWVALGIFIVFLLIKSFIKEQSINWKLSVSILFVLLVFYFFNMNKINEYFAFYRLNPDSGIDFSLFERFILAGMALAMYFRYLVFPVSLNAVYPYPNRLPDGSLQSDTFIWFFVLLMVVGITVFFIIKHKKLNRIYLFAWFFFLVNISMVMHIFPIEGRIVAADRYTYIPYIGLFMIIGVGLKDLFKYFRVSNIYLVVCSFLVLMILAPLSYSRTIVWKNTNSLFTDVLDKNPKVAFAYSVIGKSYLDKAMPDSAIVYLNKAIKIDQFDPTPYYNRAIAYNAKQDYEQAISNYKMFIKSTKLDKNKAIAFANIGEIYRNTGQDSLAIEYFNKALELDNQLSVAYNRRGLYYLENNRLINAISDFSKAIRYNQFNAEAMNNLGLAHLLNKNFDKAEAMFNQAIEINNNYSLAYDNRAYLRYLEKDFAGAIQDYNKEIEINPDYYLAYINRGRTYAAMQDFNAAIDDFNFVIEHDTLLIDAITNRAYAYYYSGNVDSAKRDFIRLTQDFSHNVSVWQNMAWFYKEKNNFDKSIEAMLEIIKIDKEYEPVYVNLGSLYIDLKEFGLAEHYLNKSLLIKPDNSQTLYLLAEVYRLTNNLQKACDFYQQAANHNHSTAQEAYNIYCNN